MLCLEGQSKVELQMLTKDYGGQDVGAAAATSSLDRVEYELETFKAKRDLGLDHSRTIFALRLCNRG